MSQTARFSALMLATVATLLVACEEEPESPPLLVYASGGEGLALNDLFIEFGELTGIPVEVVWGDSRENTDAFIDAIDSQPDVLITDNVADIWRAAEEGALRPIEAESLSHVPRSLRDGDGYWAAIELRLHRVAMTRADLEPAVTSFEHLALPELEGRVCLTSSTLPVNRSLLALLINKRGELATERMVRLWVKNLARPPFATQGALFEAMNNDECEYAIVDGRPEQDDWHFVVPETDFRNIDAIGVGRHAVQPDAAQEFVAWLLQRKRIALGGEAVHGPVGIAGWLDEDATLLAERAGYR